MIERCLQYRFVGERSIRIKYILRSNPLSMMFFKVSTEFDI